MVEVEAKLLRDPPETDMSAAAKLDVASFEVKVRVSAASLDVPPSATSAAVIVMVGPVESYTQLNCVAAVLPFPAVSVYPPAPTSMVAAPLAVGVKVAV